MKQVLILGAGASMPYGFPSMAGLRNSITNDFKTELKKWAEEYQKDVTKILEFVQGFERSEVYSIDRFTQIQAEEAKTESPMVYASRAIRWVISASEATSKERFFDSSKGGDWFALFWNRLIDRISEATPFLGRCSNITVVTFNYDRSFEYKFYEAMRNTYPSLAQFTPDSPNFPIKVIHVYGSIGGFGEIKYGEPLYIGFENSGSIRLIGDRGPEERDYLRQTILSADRLLFLGFSYDAENLKVLGLPLSSDQFEVSGNQRKIEIFGTCLGLGKGETRRIVKNIVSDPSWYFLPDVFGMSHLFTVDSESLVKDRFFID